MGHITVKGGKELENLLDTIGARTEEIAKNALYDGAGVIADAVKMSIDTIPISETWGTPELPKRGITADERLGLKEGLGISPMQTSGGETDVSVGFDGYSGKSTKRWPKGKPNAMIARSVERGTSFMYSTKFIKPAVAANKRKAVKAMQEATRKKIKEIQMGGK